MTITILQAVIVIVILGVMILLLLGINHLFSGNFSSSQSEVDDLRHDVREKRDVITENNVFGELVSVRQPEDSK